jgi:TPR repeat protein
MTSDSRESQPEALERAYAAFRRGDFVAAHEQLQVLSQAGSPLASVYLGFMYQKGLGTAVDTARAKNLYEAAARSGSADGQLYLAGLLQELNDSHGAALWYGKAVDHAASDGQVLSADDPFILASVRLAGMYERGDGVAADPNKAVDLLLGAARRGSLAAALRLGRLYRERGDLEESAAWFEQAAAGGDVSAKYWLSKLYRQGNAFIRGPGDACGLLADAARAGHVLAQRDLAVQLLRGKSGVSGLFRGAGMLISSAVRAFRLAYRNPDDPLLR